MLYYLTSSGRDIVQCEEYDEVEASEVLRFRCHRDCADNRSWVHIQSYDEGAPTRSFIIHKKVQRSRADLLKAVYAQERFQIELVAAEDDSAYLRKVEAVLSDIKSGRYYELNLLRYFTVKPQGRLDDHAVLDHWLRQSGPSGFLLRTDKQDLICFSPETFVTVRKEGGVCLLDTFPMKGSRPTARVKELATALKDQTELNMIIDLMRNDLYYLAKRNKIEVIDRGSIHTFPTISHRIAQIRAELRDDVRFGDLITHLCPAGSISGAPKKEVTDAIRCYEERKRGYFMGTAFFYDAERRLLESSVLIRTLVGRPCQGSSDWRYEYAAGSGIVALSRPEEEAAEIYEKCKILRNIF